MKEVLLICFVDTLALFWQNLCKFCSYKPKNKPYFVCEGDILHTGLKCQVYSWHTAFVSERVKGSGSDGVVMWWRMGLHWAPLLSRGPGVRGRWGKALWCHTAGLPCCSSSHNPLLLSCCCPASHWAFLLHHRVNCRVPEMTTTNMFSETSRRSGS